MPRKPKRPCSYPGCPNLTDGQYCKEHEAAARRHRLSPNVAVHPLRPATDRRLGRPLPCQLANQTRVHPIPPQFFTQVHAIPCAYAVLAAISSCCPPVWGRLPTRYSPVRHSVILSSVRKLPLKCFVRLACVRHAASVHPEPGSNSLFKCLIRSDNVLAIFPLLFL